jgi:hypothetical protein
MASEPATLARVVGDATGLDRFQTIHVGVFLAGALCFAVSVALDSGALLAAGGVGFAASGFMTILGNRITLAGPMGGALRSVLGGTRIAIPRVVGVLWVLVGLGMATLGMHSSLSGGRGRDVAPPDPRDVPAVSDAAPSGEHPRPHRVSFALPLHPV